MADVLASTPLHNCGGRSGPLHSAIIYTDVYVPRAIPSPRWDFHIFRALCLQGGGVLVYYGTVTISSSTISGNNAGYVRALMFKSSHGPDGRLTFWSLFAGRWRLRLWWHSGIHQIPNIQQWEQQCLGRRRSHRLLLRYNPHRPHWRSPSLPGTSSLAPAAALAAALAAAALAAAAAAALASACTTAHHMRPRHLPELHHPPMRDRVRPCKQRPAHGHRGAARHRPVSRCTR